MILQEIATCLGMVAPSSERDVKDLILAASRVPPDTFKGTSVACRIYLGEAFGALIDKKPVPLPVDFNQDEQQPAKAQENTSECILPTRFKCNSKQRLYSIEYLLEEVEKKEIKLPDFQRDLVWNRKRQREFIGSRLMGIPTQNLTLAIDESRGSQKYILDGYQRISTLMLFKTGKISVGPNMPELEGKVFDQLSEDVQSEFLTDNMAVMEVRAERRYWSFIFQQINKGGVSLNTTEIRRAAYSYHPLMLGLEQIAKNNLDWIGLFGKNFRYKGLASLLRAIAMYTDGETYQKPVDVFLDNYCWSSMGPDSSVTEAQVDELLKKLDFIFESLAIGPGKLSFRTSERKQANLPMLDCMVYMGLKLLDAKVPDADTPERFGKLLADARKKLLSDFECFESITKDTSGKQSTDTRLRKASSIVDDLGCGVAK